MGEEISGGWVAGEVVGDRRAGVVIVRALHRLHVSSMLRQIHAHEAPRTQADGNSNPGLELYMHFER